MSTPAELYEAWDADVPSELRERIGRAVQAASSVEERVGTAGTQDPRLLAAAALDCLRQVIASSGDRGSALDLLAADALLTRACAVAAQDGPETLAEFAELVLPQIAALVPETEVVHNGGLATGEV
jgi:hypothetical protein